MKHAYLVWHLATEADRRHIKTTHFVLCVFALSSGMLALAVALADAMQSAIGSAIAGVLALLIGSSPRFSKGGPLLAAGLFAVAWLWLGPAPSVMSAALTLWGLRAVLRCQYVSQVAGVFPPILVMIACALTKSESLAVSALSIVSIGQILVAMGWSSQTEAGKPGAFAAAKNLIVGAAVTMPIALACFLLFPRMPLGFNEVSSETAKGQTGLSDSMTPGSVAELVRNPKLAFTASFYVETLSPSEMYWRAAVFDVFDGKTWRSHPSRGSKPADIARTRATAAPHYEVSLPPAMASFVPLLEGTSPSHVNLTTGSGVTLPLSTNYAGVFENRTFAGSPVRIEAVIQQGRLPFSNKAPQEFDTQLPASGNPRARELASKWYQESDGDPEKFIQRFRREILTGPYRYTLRPDRWKGEDGIDQFMFSSQAGFCEHYAAAFVFMLRSVGIPARVVTGYQGGEVDRLDVRVLYRDAHAWSEVWMKDKGWTRIDPTTFIDPMKVEASTREALERPSGWRMRIEAWSQRMSTQWSEVVVQYGEAQQQLLIEKIIESARYLVGILFVAVLATCGWWIGIRKYASKSISKDPQKALARSFQIILNKLRDAGTDVPEEHYSPAELRKRLEQIAHQDEQLFTWLENYQFARYTAEGERCSSLHRELVSWATKWYPGRQQAAV